MSDEDVTETRLRIGGWLPSYDVAQRTMSPENGNWAAPRGASTEAQSTGGAVGPGPRVWSSPRVLMAAGAALIMLFALGIGYGWRGGRTPAVAGKPPAVAIPATVDEQTSSLPETPTPAAWPDPQTPGPDPTLTAGQLVNSGSKAAGGTGGIGGAGGTGGRAGGTGSTGAAGSSPSPTVQGSADTPLTVGTTVGLAPVSMPGYRVRHRNFVGHIDPIGPASSALDKADSTFTVRRGLADSRCVSFEAVNWPGYYLRHQNFVIYLQRIDGSALFASDATFCPVTGLAGQHTSLRSVNYPTRYVHHRGDQLYLDPVAGDSVTRTAMTFAVQPPL